MAFVRQTAANRFDIDFSAAPRPLLEMLGGLFGPRSAVVDPYRIGAALRHVIRACPIRATGGAPLVWNEFRIFLSQTDYNVIRAVLRRTSAGLDTVVRKEFDQIKAEVVGEPVIRIAFDADCQVPDGQGVVLVEFKEDRELGPDDNEEITIRLGPRRPGAAPRQVAEAPTAPTAPAQPSGDSVRAGTLRLRWPTGEAIILPGVVTRVGRAHQGAPPDFIALTGGGEKVNRVMLVLDNTADQVILTRLSGTNAVHVGGSLLQQGGPFRLRELPARITLANDALVLELDRLS